jgi:hypothetical protein
VSAPAGWNTSTKHEDLITGDLDARKAVALEIQEKSKKVKRGVSAREARLNKRRVMSDLDFTCEQLGVDLSDMTKFYTLKASTVCRTFALPITLSLMFPYSMRRKEYGLVVHVSIIGDYSPRRQLLRMRWSLSTLARRFVPILLIYGRSGMNEWESAAHICSEWMTLV